MKFFKLTFRIVIKEQWAFLQFILKFSCEFLRPFDNKTLIRLFRSLKSTFFFQQWGLEEHDEEQQQPPDIASVNVILDEQDRNKVEK